MAAGALPRATRLLKSSPKCFSLFLMKALPHAKAQPIGRRATTQVRRLALSPMSISRKCHESAMSSVMGTSVLLQVCEGVFTTVTLLITLS